MRVHIKTRVVSVAAFVLCLAVSTSDAWADGRGGGRGSGGNAREVVGGPRGFRGGRPLRDRLFGGRLFAPRGPHWEPGTLPGAQEPAEWVSPEQDHSRTTWAMQRTVEEQRLNHQLSVADHLDELAEHTGNPELHETAALHRQKALEHYEKRLSEINSNDPHHVPHEELQDGREDLMYGAEPLDQPLTEVPSRRASVPTPAAPTRGASKSASSAARPTGQNNASTPQLRDEERKLAQRMEVAERLWERYEETGNEAFAEAARALEERALADFDQRMKSVRDFQQRRGLNDQAGQAPREIEKPAPAGEVSVLVKSLP